MLSIRHQTKQGPMTYTYSTIGDDCISQYMSKWQQSKRRKQRISLGRSEYVHAVEVPTCIAEEIVDMRHRGLSWSQISQSFGFTDYLTKKVFNLQTQTQKD